MQRLILTLIIKFCFGLVTNEEIKDIDELLAIKENEKNKLPFDGKKPSKFAKKVIKKTFDKSKYKKSEFKDLTENFELIYDEKYREVLYFLKDAAYCLRKHKHKYPTLKMTDKSILYFCYCCRFSFNNIYCTFPEIHKEVIRVKGKNINSYIRVLFFVEVIQIMNWFHENKDKLLESKYFTEKPCNISDYWLGDLDLLKLIPLASLSIRPSIEKNHSKREKNICCFEF